MDFAILIIRRTSFVYLRSGWFLQIERNNLMTETQREMQMPSDEPFEKKRRTEQCSCNADLLQKENDELQLKLKQAMSKIAELESHINDYCKCVFEATTSSCVVSCAGHGPRHPSRASRVYHVVD